METHKITHDPRMIVPKTNVIFTPSEDITAFELAHIFAFMLKHNQAVFQKETLDSLPENCKRHFKDKDYHAKLQAILASPTKSD